MTSQPLAYKLRPQHIDEIFGQQHLVGEGKIIRRMVDAGRLSSMILYGPPGIGKTSIASAIAGTTGTEFKVLNAVTNNKKDLETTVLEAKMYGKMIVLLDEIHRLDKPKQDFLLPHLESGLIVLIGATTSNPYFAINPALRSRCQIFELKALEPEDISSALKRALHHEANGFGNHQIDLKEDAIELLSIATNGDVRSALNALELAVLSTTPNEDGVIVIDQAVAEECVQRKTLTHDKDGDAHYDVLSALQKSIRGSDVNAALHYMARLIIAGDLQSLTRRLLVIAYEDVGLANPAAGERMLAAITAAERLGLPEARIPLSVAVVECCLSPKSNSAYSALDGAIVDIHKGNTGDVPDHLKDAHYKGAKELGRGLTYQYPHDFENGWVKQQYLPDKIKHKKYFKPKTNSKFEGVLAEVYRKLNK